MERRTCWSNVAPFRSTVRSTYLGVLNDVMGSGVVEVPAVQKTGGMK